jgi:hypothetical protein
LKFRHGLIALSLTAAALITPSVANAQTSDIAPAASGVTDDSSSIFANLPSLTPGDLAAMSAAEVYAAKTRVTHDEPMRHLGATEPTPKSESLMSPSATVGCVFVSDGDDVHTSVADGVNYASGHGWWVNGTCPSSWRADVTVWLEEKLGGGWYPQGSKTKPDLAPGGERGNRATRKTACLNFNSHKWRSVVAVDLVGHPEVAPAAYTPVWTLACY